MMRTVRCSGRLGGGLPEGGVCLGGGDICLGEGGVYPLGTEADTPPLPPDPEVDTPRPRGRHTPPWTQFLTHACENITYITFPQLLLRTVIRSSHK